MVSDYVNKINTLNGAKVHIKDRDYVNRILKNIIEGGKENLQIISDFDRTLTKQHVGGEAHISSFAIFRSCPSISPRYFKDARALTLKYYPIEIDTKIPVSEKKIVMEKWWSEINDTIKGEIVTSEELYKTTLEKGPSLRDDTATFLNDLNRANIPLLVFSAGLGDSVLAVLKNAKVFHPNIKVFANFLSYNSDGVIEGFKNDPLIHVFNKNEVATKDTEYLNSIRDRTNVIVMGDSIGDANMAEGICTENILKIGFYYDPSGEHLSSFVDTFDIVLEDDQTMHVPQDILNEIL